MARVVQFERILKDRPKIHGPVNCGYCSFIGEDGKRYLLLETYGSPDRQIPGKVSQSLQLDEGAARELLQIIRQEFPGIE